jgi:opacity protein-like surface antigen
MLANARSSDTMGDLTFTFNRDVQGSAVIGWDFEPGNPLGEGRVELEYSRRSNAIDQVKFSEGSFKGSGKVAADSVLVNFIGAFHDGSRWAPYAGLGIGAARIEAIDLKVIGQPLGSGSAVVVAYQVVAGFDLALTDYLNLDLGYRLFSTARPKFTEVNGQKFEMDYLNHAAVLGLRAGF